MMSCLIGLVQEKPPKERNKELLLVDIEWKFIQTRGDRVKGLHGVRTILTPTNERTNERRKRWEELQMTQLRNFG